MTDLPPHTKTLNELFLLPSPTDQELQEIVEGLRKQSELWNAEQAQGSRKLVKSSKITTEVKRPQNLTKTIKGLKL